VLFELNDVVVDLMDNQLVIAVINLLVHLDLLYSQQPLQHYVLQSMDLMMIKQDFQNLDDRNYSNDELIDEIEDELFEVLNVLFYF
jgi:hypothetical protein